MEEKGSRRNSGESAGRQVRHASLGITVPGVFAASIIVATALGYGLDRWLGTGPWLTLVFLALGIAAGIREMINLLRKMDS